MFEGHNSYLVALSVAIAILGGYTGFGLAARVRGRPGASRRLLLAGAAWFLATGIWTMHFVATLAAPLPPDTVYLVLPTVVSFLICALVVGVSVFFVSVGEPNDTRIISSAVMLGAGIVSMHYVGVHGLAGDFHIEHDRAMVLLAGMIAVGAAYGGLRVFLARHDGIRLVLSAVAFGLAVSGMHYTAMYGMHFLPGAEGAPAGISLVASEQVLSLVVALLCFALTAGFLLFLVPEPRLRTGQPALAGAASALGDPGIGGGEAPAPRTARRPAPAPLGGLGQHRRPPVSRLPVQGANGTQFVDVSAVRGVKADAHYTLVHDGTRERMCPWSISEVEAQLDEAVFMRVHRSHIVAIPHVTAIRKEGDGALVELDGPEPHLVPVSRARIAEVRARLGLASRRASDSRVT